MSFKTLQSNVVPKLTWKQAQTYLIVKRYQLEEPISIFLEHSATAFIGHRIFFSYFFFLSWIQHSWHKEQQTRHSAEGKRTESLCSVFFKQWKHISQRGLIGVLLMTRSPGTNYLDSGIIKVFRKERKKRKMLVIFFGLSLSLVPEACRKNRC